ncbi:MAG TPA: 2-keto-4-pentenoate hydratase [Sporosarcina sp.]|nr:2-keto-4-pentenoate hydratase [Sporosarcina sp.]
MGKITTTVANDILQAYTTRKPIDFIRHTYSLTEAEAYEVQDELIQQLATLQGASIAGYKISMTSVDTQAIALTDEPAYGTLLSTTLKQSGDIISMDSLFEPLIEPEIHFILQEDLSPIANEEEIISKSKVCAGIEVPDARYKNWFPNFSLADLLADNTATGLVVLSEPVDPLTFEQFANVQMELFHNGLKISEGNASAVLENPVSSVKWLAGKLAEHGKTLKKGMVISSGTFISPIRAEKGTYKINYSSIGSVDITFN